MKKLLFIMPAVLSLMACEKTDRLEEWCITSVRLECWHDDSGMTKGCGYDTTRIACYPTEEKCKEYSKNIKITEKTPQVLCGFYSTKIQSEE